MSPQGVSWRARLTAAPSAAAAAVVPLEVGDALEKARCVRTLAAAWRAGDVTRWIAPDDPAPPDTPARPDKPRLAPPRELAKRRLGSAAGRAALLHAVAHIELNAMDLACDLIARFAAAPEWDGRAPNDAPADDVRRAFLDDWFAVADDEARHFMLVHDRLADYDAVYGDWPAHDGLWSAARDTAGDLLARLAVAPLVFEARGLDVTPDMIAKLRRAGDDPSAEILDVIYRDEIGHVAAGARWFLHVCARRNALPHKAFAELTRRYVGAALKPPFNIEARDAANLPSSWYMTAVDVSGADGHTQTKV